VKQKSKRASGLAFQRWIKAWLEEKGWFVHNQTPAGRMIVIKGKKIFISQRNDIFGCDLICLKEERKLLFIQATLDSNLKRKIDELKKYFSVKKYPYEVDVQVWLKTEKGEINIKQINIFPEREIVVILGKIIRKKFYSLEGIEYEF